MNFSSPLVSIIIPCYNPGEFLSEALDSVSGQTYTHWECIIINDGSTDNSEEIANKFCAKDPRFKYIQKENGGSASTRNVGLKNASGKYVQFLDADDYLYPDKIALSVEALKKDNDINVVVSNFKMFTNNIEEPYDAFCLLKENYLNAESILFGWDNEFSIPIHCGFFKAALFTNFSFNEHIRAKEDWIMWISIFLKDAKAIFLDVPLALYRMHPNNKTKDERHMHNNRIDAYKLLIQSLPDAYSKRFSYHAIETMNKQMLEIKQELLKNNDIKLKILDSGSYKIGNFMVNVYRRLTFKGNS